jgi:hypothetical protein
VHVITEAAHVIAWRDDLLRRQLDGSTIRHRLAALSSLFNYLCEKNAVTHNPVKGVKRPRAESGEGKTPALGDPFHNWDLPPGLAQIRRRLAGHDEAIASSSIS